MYLEILVLLINSEERVKDYRSHSELVTTGGQLACSKRDYEVECSLEPLVLSRDFKPRRVPKSYMENWIRLHCRRLSNLGLITTYSRTEHLLEYLISRLMETSKTAISWNETLRNALRTDYQKLSNSIWAKYATGEVSKGEFLRDGRGSVVPMYIGKGPKHFIWHQIGTQIRSYATRSGTKKLIPVVESKDLQILAKHWWICYHNREKVFKDLRGILKLENIWFAAYNKLKKKPGSQSPGLDSVTIESITKERILELREAVLRRKFHWQGIQQVMIPKPGKPGKTRPLGIPTINDRLVQEVIRSIIEPIFELNFSDQSHGFRPNRSSHTALKWMYTQMKDSMWFVEGDIKSNFPTINQSKLLELIQRRVSDPIILELIRKGLKAKVFPYGGEEYIAELGTPQGGILSALLSNIYLHELDKYMETLMKEYQGSQTCQNRKRKPLAMKQLKALEKSSYYGRNISYYDPNDKEYTNCKYIRYAEDFIIGIVGNRKMAEEIRDKVKAFLEDELKVELSLEKSHITHISKGIPFLGYKFSRRTIFIRQRYLDKIRKRRMKIQLSVDMPRVVKRLALAGYCTKGGEPRPNFKFLQLPQSQTNRKINYVLRGLSEWFKIAGNRKRAIGWLSYILKTSTAKIYAAKFKLKTTAAVFKIAGNDLGRPLGVRAKSVIGLDENKQPKKDTLKGLLYSEYHMIPQTENNIKAAWKPEYLKLIEKSKDSLQLIEYLQKEELNKPKTFFN